MAPLSSAYSENHATKVTGAYLRDLDAILRSARIENGNHISKRLQSLIPVIRKMEVLGEANAFCADLKEYLFPIIEVYCAPNAEPDELAEHVDRLRHAIAHVVATLNIQTR